MDHEAVGQQVHDAPAEAQGLDAAEALAEDDAGAGRAEPEEAQGERGDADRNARPWSRHVTSRHDGTTWFAGRSWVGGGKTGAVGHMAGESYGVSFAEVVYCGRTRVRCCLQHGNS